MTNIFFFIVFIFDFSVLAAWKLEACKGRDPDSVLSQEESIQVCKLCARAHTSAQKHSA